MLNIYNETLTLDHIYPGMILGAPVVIHGQFYLHSGTELTPALLDRLRDLGFDRLTIRRGIQLHKRTELTVEEKKFVNTYQDTVGKLHQAFDNVRFFKELPLQRMEELAGESIDQFVEQPNVINHLQLVRHQDEYTFQHSINVSIIAGIIAKWMGFKGAELRQVVLTGLLHDIGKTQVPLEILNKPGKLTPQEMAIMKRHTAFGYDLLKKAEVAPHVFLGALQHHERNDGTGYPLRVSHENIHEYARITAVADLYDAMTSNRVYQKKRTPFVVIETLAREMFSALDPTICLAFLDNIRSYLMGGTVVLSNGQEGEIVYLDNFALSRIVVAITDGTFIRLDERKDLKVVDFYNF
ncbi:MAG TPA: HD-GYP domain-containing protein [Patescibacteria group bacterium]|nr:HD-GYP domain-containing protein [Patescibacteria group bacterium]